MHAEMMIYHDCYVLLLLSSSLVMLIRIPYTGESGTERTSKTETAPTQHKAETAQYEGV